MNNFSISDDLKRLVNNDYAVNLNEVIPHIREITKNYIRKSNKNLNIGDLLNRKSFDESYVSEQCLSILDYIEFLCSDELKNTVLKDRLLMDITQSFIFDFKYFNSCLVKLNIPKIYDPDKDIMLTSISMDRYAKSMEAFIAAKDLMHFPKESNPFTYKYNKSIAIFSIRHAIELKVKREILGINDVVYKNKKGIYEQANISISKYIDFLQNEGSSFFEFPSDVNIDNLREVNKWSNDYIHTGFYPYIWQVNSAILAIKPLFIYEYNNRLKTYRFEFRASGFSIDKLKDKLENKFSSTRKNLEFCMQY